MYREEDEAPGMEQRVGTVDSLKKRIAELEEENEMLRQRLWQTARELVLERHKEVWKRLGQE